jgi:hypothetical protein
MNQSKKRKCEKHIMIAPMHSEFSAFDGASSPARNEDSSS